VLSFWFLITAAAASTGYRGFGRQSTQCRTINKSLAAHCRRATFIEIVAVAHR